MKRRLLYSLLIGFGLLLLSLFYKVGNSSLEPMPYLNGGCGRGGVCGVVIDNPPPPVSVTQTASRGLPLPIVSINPDEDKPSNYYKSLILGNLLIDYVIFTGASYGFLSLIALYKNSDNKQQKPQ